MPMVETSAKIRSFPRNLLIFARRFELYRGLWLGYKFLVVTMIRNYFSKGFLHVLRGRIIHPLLDACTISTHCHFHALYFIGIIPCIQDLYIRSEPCQPFLQLSTPRTHVDFSSAE